MSNIVETELVQEPQGKPPSGALVRMESGAVGRALTTQELHQRLEFIREVMRTEMREGTDYGKIPGTGEKPTLLQPGAQKLLMTFNLREQVKKEVLREYPGWHREYEFTVTVFPAGLKPEDGWDGVGTCSTLESKYRYRKAERKCPVCGKPAIIKGKEEYGGGWVCFAKKGGCKAKFDDNDPAITSQPAAEVENDDPADCWNTVRKMGFKRALVAASINATNTSELWTQDLEETVGAEPGAPRESKGGGRRATGGGKAPTAPSSERGQGEFEEEGGFESAGQQRQPGTTAAAQKPPARPFPTLDSLKRMIAELNARPGGENEEIVTEYFRSLDKPSALFPNEALEELDLRFVPGTASEMRKLAAAITEFQLTKVAKWPYAPHVPADPKQVTKAKASTPKPVTVPREHKAPGTDLPAELADEIVPIPRKGMKLNDYLKDPDTIGSLYAARHDDAAARARLFGFMHNFQPAGFNGMPPKDSDVRFRDVLDQLAEWYEENHPDEVSDA